MIRFAHPARLGGTIVGLLLVAALAAGCSSGGSASIKVTEPWARASSAMAAAGAAYMTIQNTGSSADALIGVSSPAARTAEVHETVAIGSPMPSASGGMGAGSPMPSASGGMGAGSPMPSASGEGGMMGMRPIERLEIPAGGTVELKPGSYHIMLIDLTRDLKAGDKIEITLKLEKAGEITVTAQVRES